MATLAQSSHPMLLVREGVVWHYACPEVLTDSDGLRVDSTFRIIDQKMQFVGDTTVCGISYKKCYRYVTDQLASHDSPVALAREKDGKVYFASLQADSCERPFLTLQGEFESITREYQVYDFDSVYAFASWLDLYYHDQVDTVYVTQVTPTMMGDSQVNSYELNLNARYVEGVGIDGPFTGFLDNPFPRRSDVINPSVLGLIMLTDLEGNVLYQGEYATMDEWSVVRFDLNHDGRVDIADINIMINVVLGYDVPTGHQGHDTAPPLLRPWQFDVTGDQVLDISDVNAIINVLLGR